MRSAVKRLARYAVCVALVMILFLCGAAEAYAITTEFMVPTISTSFTPDNCIYKSPNLNIMVSKWSYGWVADLLNDNRDLDALLAELNANFTVSPTTSKEAIMGIYMEGAPITARNAADIAAGNWKRVELYYENFLAGGSIPRGAMMPNVAKSADADALAALADAGVTADAAVVEVSGFDMASAKFILYEKEFKFLRGKTVSAYKFLPDLKKFVSIPEVYFDSYDRNFLELHDLQLAEADVNGIYVALGQTLPAELTLTAAEAADLRANPPKEPAVLVNSLKTVEWRFLAGEAPEGFSPEAVTSVEGTEVTVDFAYSGLLPEGTEVTVEIPTETAYADGTELFFYYCDLDTQTRELVSRGTAQGGKVTFAIGHCSVYVITAEDHGAAYQPEVKQESSSGTGDVQDAPAVSVPDGTEKADDIKKPEGDGALPGEPIPTIGAITEKTENGDVVTGGISTTGVTDAASGLPVWVIAAAVCGAAVLAAAVFLKGKKK